jgi:hypothetical protein
MLMPINIFIIYAREDKEIKQRLLLHLNPLKNEFNANIWHDEYIEPGQAWKPSIESRLEKTDLFLLLVSVDFMNSEFINHVEFKYAIDRHRSDKSIMIPIIIKFCQWKINIHFNKDTFNLSELQVLPPEGRPIEDWKTADQAYNEVAAGIITVLTTIKRRKEQESRADNNEDVLWQKAEEAGRKNLYIEYLETYPEGKYKKSAVEAITGLDKLAQLKENNLWEEASKINTLGSYQNYLSKTELKEYIDEANDRIAILGKEDRQTKVNDRPDPGVSKVKTNRNKVILIIGVCLAALFFLIWNGTIFKKEKEGEITPVRVYGLYPQSSQRILTLQDIAGLTKWDIRIMRNEIFARHNYIFANDTLIRYFNQQPWYKGIYRDVTSQLSTIERINLIFIRAYE